jgi:DNA-binding helix-turn-helix protein
MTREEKIDMFCMRMDGYTLQEIGDKYGVTREYVRQVLDVGKRKDKFSKIVYPKLKQYMIERKLSIRKLSILIDIQSATATRLLYGESSPTMSTVNKILKLTGLTYEEAFYLEGEDTDEKNPTA